MMVNKQALFEGRNQATGSSALAISLPDLDREMNTGQGT
jgi:hypothetical protein